MLQKAAKWRLFASKTSQLRSPSAPPSHLLRSCKFCMFATDEKPRVLEVTSQIGISF